MKLKKRDLEKQFTSVKKLNELLTAEKPEVDRQFAALKRLNEKLMAEKQELDRRLAEKENELENLQKKIAEPTEKPGGDKAVLCLQLFDKADANKDGTVTGPEVTTFSSAYKASDPSIAHVDEDVSITKEQFTQACMKDAFKDVVLPW